MNKVVHFEVPAEDLERAKKFYSAVFGWKLDQLGPEMGNYVMVRTTEVDEKTRMPSEPGAINGGMMVRMRPVKSPVITIAVEDIDAAIAQVKANGGRLAKKKQKVGDMGFSAYVKDSEGNIIGLWQSRRSM
jgi:uncharacterized protein